MGGAHDPRLRHFVIARRTRAGYTVPMVALLMRGLRGQTRVALRGGRGGQTMIEYVIVFVALFGALATLAILLYALRQQSNRVLDLVASDYP